MEKMKRNLLFVPFIAVLALMFVAVASAGELTYALDTEFNGVTLFEGSSNDMSGAVGDVVPVRVTFDAAKDMSDVKVKVYMEGHRDDVSASTARFDVEEDVTYTRLLSLRLPSDSDDLSEHYVLYVEVVSKSDRTIYEYDVRMQRESYTFEVLSVDYNSRVSAGEVFPVSVVVKNNGYKRMDDTYVVVSIPALGVSTRGYVGDIVPTEKCYMYEDDDDDLIVSNCDDDDEDSFEEVVYLKIPTGVAPGVYDMEVEVYNEDSETVVNRLISVDDSESTLVLAAVKNQDLGAGETVTYDLVIVNSANDVKVFGVETVSGSALAVSAPSVVTVGPDSSETVSVTVRANNDAAIGTYTFSVDVDGRSTVFGANVVEETTSTSAVALTVVLVIVFVVLLIVLVVLLTRKEKPIEEVETSYY